MVIVNPKLSLPTDLPYKKRQRPFYSNTPLQQATIRYNEAIRKKYNDIQFAKRLENGSATQNETTGVNTIDIAKMVDPVLFSEMSNTSPTSMKRKSKPLSHVNEGSDLIGSCRNRHVSTCMENVKPINTNIASAMDQESFPVRNTNNNGNNNNSSYDCNSTEMFPTLQATVNTDNEKNCNAAYNNSNAAASVKPPSTPSLEAQAINEYEPTIDSQHDMIFGNVMGLDYGNYMHGPLWGPQPQQQQQQQHGVNNGSEPPQHFHTAPPSVCCSTKLTAGGYMQPPTLMHSVPTPPPPIMYDINSNMINENGIINPLPGLGKHGAPGGPGRRATSVPRPRTGTQKETLKQAAIRCGIIKGNHTVAAISKRSHCLVPLQLTPVHSDPVVSVIEILHPKGTIPACSSEALVEFEDLKFRTLSSDSNGSETFVVHNNKSTPALNIVTNMNAPGDSTNTTMLDKSRMATEKSNSEGHNSQVPTNVNHNGSAIPTLESAISCPTL